MWKKTIPWYISFLIIFIILLLSTISTIKAKGDVMYGGIVVSMVPMTVCSPANPGCGACGPCGCGPWSAHMIVPIAGDVGSVFACQKPSFITKGAGLFPGSIVFGTASDNWLEKGDEVWTLP